MRTFKEALIWLIAFFAPLGVVVSLSPPQTLSQYMIDVAILCAWAMLLCVMFIRKMRRSARNRTESHCK